MNNASKSPIVGAISQQYGNRSSLVLNVDGMMPLAFALRIEAAKHYSIWPFRFLSSCHQAVLNVYNPEEFRLICLSCRQPEQLFLGEGSTTFPTFPRDALIESSVYDPLTAIPIVGAMEDRIIAIQEELEKLDMKDWQTPNEDDFARIIEAYSGPLIGGD